MNGTGENTGGLRRNRATIIVGIAICALLIAAWALGRTTAREGARALVHAGDGSVYELTLDADGSLEVQTDLGRNVICVEGGAVHMEEADCPGGNCLRQGAISRPGEQIICMPHGLWVEIVGPGGAGGEMDADAVVEDGAVDLVSG